jgi:hypothetical protein
MREIYLNKSNLFQLKRIEKPQTQSTLGTRRKKKREKNKQQRKPR